MNSKQLKKYMKPSKRVCVIYLDEYTENDDNTITFTYHVKGQGKSHLKVDTATWDNMEFKSEEGNIIIAKSDLKVLVNENGWKRLAKDTTEEEDE